MTEIDLIYQRRFSQDIEFRKEMYEVLCRHFFQKYVSEGSTIIDIAAGYCEFINSIRAKRKIALDINPDVKKFAGPGVEVILSSSVNMKPIESDSVDTAFTSNFFEHLSKEDIVRTIREVHRILKEKGSFLILQPNIRYCYKDYWMFFDHITPLDDRSLSEALEVNGFRVIESKPRFLPYTTKSKLPKSIFLLKLYLKVPAFQWFAGKQAFLLARKV